MAGARRVTLLLGSTFVALFACESVLRAVHFTRRLDKSADRVWPWILYDPILNRKNQPSFVLDELAVRINSSGLRGDEISPRKPPHTSRIACLGDSATFGIWLEGPLASLRASYPSELTRLLRDKGYHHVEVINAGVLGHTTGEGLAQLLTQILPLKPDVVTVRYGNNDHVLMRTSQLPPASRPWEYAVLRLLPARAFSWELVRLGFHAYRQVAAMRAPPSRRYLVPIEQFERNLLRFVEIGRTYGVRILFIDFPYREISRGESPGETFPNYFTDARTLAELHAVHDRYQAVVEEVASRTGTPLLRTAEALRASPTPVFTDYDLSHPNQAGAELLARLVFAELDRLGWLTPP